MRVIKTEVLKFNIVCYRTVLLCTSGDIFTPPKSRNSIPTLKGTAPNQGAFGLDNYCLNC